MSSEFLSAKWENLIIITFKTSPDNLIKFLPYGLELDTINGEAFISIVAFDFNDTKVKGISIPFINNFPEINLRYYVRKNDKRGVVFIKEFVPKSLVALVAKLIYNEPYEKIDMSCSSEINSKIKIVHEFTKDSNDYSIILTAENKPYLPMEDTMEHFLKEHSFGFGKMNGRTTQYEVHHPVWEIYPVLDYAYNVDFGKLYGSDFEFLNAQQPVNVLFAKGSEVKVFTHQKID
jgi:uncharacterized protein